VVNSLTIFVCEGWVVNVIKIKRGLDIPIVGEASPYHHGTITSSTAVLYPEDFNVPGLSLRPVVMNGDKVEVGTPLLMDSKYNMIRVASPVSGEVIISRGEKRKLLNVRILADREQSYKRIECRISDTVSICEFLLESGLWVYINQRPFGIIPLPDYKPRDIYVIMGSSAPLAPDYYTLYGDYLNYTIDVIGLMTKLTTGKLYLVFHNVSHKEDQNKIFKFFENRLKDGVEIIVMEGPHPACTLSVVINRHKPVNKGEVVWGLTLDGLVRIGYTLKENKLLNVRKVALVGSGWKQTGYITMYDCGDVSKIIDEFLKKDKEYRVISGDVLTGKKIEDKGAIHFYDNMISAIPEGKYRDFMGWALPSTRKYSFSRLVFPFKIGNKKWDIDTNLHGEERPFVISGEYEKVFPMDDIYPQEFVKYCIARDIDAMEELGGYEVVPEDFALCEFICTSKVPVQRIVREALKYMYQELS